MVVVVLTVTSKIMILNQIRIIRGFNQPASGIYGWIPDEIFSEFFLRSSFLLL
jgi:hypothetical protein